MRYFLSVAISYILLLNIGTGFSMGKAPDIEHRITYSNQGSRSEARHGHLYINEIEVPDIFTLVICRNQAFKFQQRAQLWGNDGYFPVEEAKENIAAKESSAEIGKDSIVKGWYLGKERLSGTPADWIYVEWNEGNAFLSPEKIKEMAAVLKLIIIPRWKTPALKLKTNN